MSNLQKWLKGLIQKHPWLSSGISLYLGSVSEREGFIWVFVKAFFLGVMP